MRAAASVVELEVGLVVLPVVDVGVLRDEEDAGGAVGEERMHEAVDGLRGGEVFGVVALRVGEGVLAQERRLNGDEFFVVRLDPVLRRRSTGTPRPRRGR